MHGCLRPTPTDNLAVLSGIQPAELHCQGATLCQGFGLGDRTGPAEESKRTKCVQGWSCQIGLGTLFAIHTKLFSIYSRFHLIGPPVNRVSRLIGPPVNRVSRLIGPNF